MKEQGYYQQSRTELLRFIPESAKAVLDVGCGEGFFGEQLRHRGATTVAGIEFDEAAAAAARTRLTQVVQGDIQTVPLPFEPGSFDAVVCADVLEHLTDPWRTLTRLRTYLAPGGLLVASIPNARYISLIAHLADGHWTYQSSGLLDRDHLRFFTLAEIRDLLGRAGFRLTDLGANMGEAYGQYKNQADKRELRYGRVHIRDLTPEEFIHFFVFQYVVQAQVA